MIVSEEGDDREGQLEAELIHEYLLDANVQGKQGHQASDGKKVLLLLSELIFARDHHPRSWSLLLLILIVVPVLFN